MKKILISALAAITVLCSAAPAYAADRAKSTKRTSKQTSKKKTSSKKTTPPNSNNAKYVLKAAGKGATSLSLFAVWGKNEKNLGDANALFDGDTFGNIKIFDQADYDGNGTIDAVIRDSSFGNDAATQWLFVVNRGDGNFTVTDSYAEYDGYSYAPAEVDGRKVIEFSKNDMGRKHVFDRIALDSAALVTLEIPDFEAPKFKVKKTVEMENLNNKSTLKFDINGDGKKEKLTGWSDTQNTKTFRFATKDKDYEVTVRSMWGAGKLHFLKSSTNGMCDLMVELETRTLYRWNGSEYVEVSENIQTTE